MTASDTPAPQPTSRWPFWFARERRRMAWCFLIALVLLVFSLFPAYWLFITSIESAGDIFARRPPAGLAPEPAELSYLRGAVQGRRRLGDLQQPDHCQRFHGRRMVLGTAVAHSLARFKTGGQNLAIWIIAQRMVPLIVTVVPIFLLFVWFGWIDSHVG